MCTHTRLLINKIVSQTLIINQFNFILVMKNLQSRTKVRLLQSLLLISLSLFFLVNPAYAQGGFAVKGVIVDKTGFPLPGGKRLRDSI